MAEFDPYFLPEDSKNPYAPPETSLKADQPLFYDDTDSGVYEAFTVGNAVSRAWRIFKDRPLMVLCVTIAPQILAQVLNFVLTAIGGAVTDQNNNPAMQMTVAGLIMLIGVLFQTWLTLGQAKVLVKTARERPASFSELFSGGPYFLSYLWGMILYALAYLAVVLVIGIPFGGVALLLGIAGNNPPGPAVGVAIVGAIVGIVTLIWFSLRLSPLPFVIVDRGLGGYAAVRTSYEITSGHAVDLFGLVIISILLVFLGLLLCLVGVLITGPVAMFAWSCGYVQIAAENWGTRESFERRPPELLG